MDFDRAFDAQLRGLEELIAAGKADADTLLKRVEETQLQVKERLDSLSTHDREKYDTRLQQARERIWKLKKPKRFQFKSTKLRESKTPSAAPPRAAEPAAEPAADPAAEPAAEPAQRAKTRQVVFEDKQQANLHFADLERSVIVAHNITGALHLTRIRHSRVIAKCSQCRIHDCVDIDVHIEGCTNPVIENSSRVRFYAAESPALRVSDFSWMRSEANPNYSIEPLGAARHELVSSYSLRDAQELAESM